MRLFRAGIVMLFLCTLGACGGGGSSSTTSSVSGTPVTVSGVAATGAAIVGGTVTLTDVNGHTATGTTDGNGHYSIDASGLTLPVLAKIQFSDATGTATVLYSYAATAGTANINPLANAAVMAATGTASVTFSSSAQTELRNNLATAIANLQTLQTRFGADTGNPITGSYIIGTGLDKLFDLVAFTVDGSGNISIKTKYDGTVIASGTVTNLAGLTVTDNSVPVEDNTAVHITNMNITSGEVGSNIILTMDGLTGLDPTKYHVFIGGMAASATLVQDAEGKDVALDVIVPPGCPSGNVAVVEKPINGSPVVGYAGKFTVTAQHDYAVGSVMFSSTAMVLEGYFPYRQSVNITLTQNGNSIMVSAVANSTNVGFTIPSAIDTTKTFTVKVTSADGTKSSNLFNYVP